MKSHKIKTPVVTSKTEEIVDEIYKEFFGYW